MDKEEDQCAKVRILQSFPAQAVAEVAARGMEKFKLECSASARGESV